MLERALLAFALAVTATGASANPELLRMQRDPNQWGRANGNYASWRYSELNQINKENVKDLQVAWTFSTGVLRGHEGGAAGDRRHDVRPHPVPEQGVRARPRRPGRSSGSTSRSRTRR